MQFSWHAEKKMAERGISRAELENVVAAPRRGTYNPEVLDRREHFGNSTYGRPINVVTNRAETVVTTVVL